jgi:hypothetical protein
MLILIENPETSELLSVTGEWTRQPATAKAFANVTAALRAGRQLPVGRFDVSGYLPDSRQFINLQHGRGTGRTDAA